MRGRKRERERLKDGGREREGGRDRKKAGPVLKKTWVQASGEDIQPSLNGLWARS